jgi:hypothetical protein
MESAPHKSDSDIIHKFHECLSYEQGFTGKACEGNSDRANDTPGRDRTGNEMMPSLTESCLYQQDGSAAAS